MLNLKSKFNRNPGKLLISLSILLTTIGLASCAPYTPNSEAEDSDRPEQVQDASNQQTQPLNPPALKKEDSDDEDKIKQQEEGNYNKSNDDRDDAAEKQNKDEDDDKPGDGAN